MLHRNRAWCVAKVETAEQLADKLSEHTWCGCNGFELDNYLWLNDSTGPDNAQEYAVVQEPTDNDPEYRQVESITVSWCTKQELLAYIKSIHGDYPPPLMEAGPVVVARTKHEFLVALGSKQRPAGHVVHPTLETPQEHGRCPLCA